MYIPPVKKAINNPRHSECDSAKLIDLDWNNWWQDFSFSSHYIHVRHMNLDDETWHRVYPRLRKGYTCKSIAVWDGILHWTYTSNHQSTTKTTKRQTHGTKNT